MTRTLQLAIIDEDNCVGCSKCLPACPVDAIIGTLQHTHTIISQECIGCGLCLDPCPMDCIELLPIDIPQFDPEKAKQRHLHKRQRLTLATQLLLPAPALKSLAERKAYIMAAVKRKNPTP